MAEYESYSVSICKEISKFTLDSLTTIEKLDKNSQHVSRKIDRQIRIMKNGDFLVNAKNLNKHRKLIEILATRKIQLAVKNYDFIDQNMKAIDAEIALLEKVLQRTGNITFERVNVENGTTGDVDELTGKVRKSIKRKHGEDDISEDGVLAESETIASSEPVYCVCKRIAFGDMVACDNDECPIEWFHYACVNLTKKPKNSWLCPSCSNAKKVKK